MMDPAPEDIIRQDEEDAVLGRTPSGTPRQPEVSEPDGMFPMNVTVERDVLLILREVASYIPASTTLEILGKLDLADDEYKRILKAADDVLAGKTIN